MAWEEESIEGGADFEEVGDGKKSKIKLIIIIVVALAVLGGIGFGVKTFMDKSPDDAAAEGEEEVVEEAPEPETGFRVNLEKFTLNLSTAGGGEPHYLITSIVLEVTTTELKEELQNVEDPKLYMIKTRDTILSILRAKTYKEIGDAATSKEVAKEIKFKLDRIYQSGKVLNVYFNEFVVQ